MFFRTANAQARRWASRGNGIDFLYAWRQKLAAYKPVPVEHVEVTGA